MIFSRYKQSIFIIIVFLILNLKIIDSYVQPPPNSNINNIEVAKPVTNQPIKYQYQPINNKNELPDYLQWDTIEKLSKEIVMDFLQKLLTELSQANDYSAKESPFHSPSKSFISSYDSIDIKKALISLLDKQINIRNLTYFIALLYMDKISNKVQTYQIKFQHTFMYIYNHF